MRGFLLDTNVVSELTKRSPDSGVIAFLTNQSDLWLSSVVLHELAFGLNLLPPGQRRDRIGAALAALVAEYADRVIVLSATEAEDAALLRAQAHRSGRVLHLGTLGPFQPVGTRLYPSAICRVTWGYTLHGV